MAGADFLQLDPAAAPVRGRSDWIVQRIRAAILTGELAEGARLPATRDLAADLGWARGTIVTAYQTLGEQGLIHSGPRTGTVVAHRRADAPGTPVPAPQPWRGPLIQPHGEGVEIDLSPNVPDLTGFPRQAWLRAERRALDGAGRADLGYGDPRGSAVLRGELARWLVRVRGVRVHPDGLLVVAGVAQALALLAQVLVRHDRLVIGVEDPGSRGSRDELAHWGLEVCGVPVDGEGLVVAELAASEARSVMVTPAHQFPTGVALSPERRRELLAWAAESDRLVIEDDYDAEQRYDRSPTAALQGLAPEHVAHTGSVSKALAPAMRLGWLSPPPELLPELIEARYASDLGSPAIPQLALADLLATGRYDQHLRATRRRHRQRRDALVAAVRTHLPGVRVVGLDAGLHLVLELPGELDDTAVSARVGELGVRVHPLSWHRLSPGPPGLVVGFAAHPGGVLDDAVRRIARALG